MVREKSKTCLKPIFLYLILFISYNSYSRPIEFGITSIFNSQSIYRGAPIWKTPLLMIVPSVKITENFSIRGRGANYKFFDRLSKWQSSISLQFFNDDNRSLNLLKSNDKPSFRNLRDDSLHFDIDYSYNFGYRNSFSIKALGSIELINYYEPYFELSVGMPVLPFTKLEFTQSYGTSKTHKYLFGDGAKSGLGHIRGSLIVFIPSKFAFWKAMTIVKTSYSRISSGHHSRLSKVRGDDKNISLSLILNWKLGQTK